MNVAGSLRLDLSPYVDDWGCLFIGDVEIHGIYGAVGSFVGDLVVEIGCATRFTVPDRRLVECLPGIESVSVIGSNPRGVVEAVQALRALTVPSQRGPEDPAVTQ